MVFINCISKCQLMLCRITVSTLRVRRWHYWHGNKLAIHRSRVWVLAGHHCVVALGLLTPVCLCHPAVQFSTGQGEWSLWLEK